jgi:cob(I)alamin adenosyltransferase
MTIYTKAGDKGRTTLAGGQPVSKTHVRLEAYGTLDELISHIGLIRDYTEDGSRKELLLRIQSCLMTCAAILATDNKERLTHIPDLEELENTLLETSIDDMEEQLPPLRSFILPGGNPVSSQCHIARTVCRRAERQIIKVSEQHFVPNIVLRYINRLSDYLFVLARKILHENAGEDIPWNLKL